MSTVRLVDGTEVDSARDIDRLMKSVSMIPIAGCWVWLGAMANGGYGSAWLRGRVVGAHRAMYELCVGPIPRGAEVCHRCDVRCCINPDHLFLGTKTDNMRDAAAKARLGHHCAKLTFEQAEEIRASPLRGAELARAMGVSPNIVSRIRRGHYYRSRHALRKAG